MGGTPPVRSTNSGKRAFAPQARPPRTCALDKALILIENRPPRRAIGHILSPNRESKMKFRPRRFRPGLMICSCLTSQERI